MSPIRSGGTNPKDLVGAKKAPLSLVPSALVIGASEAMENGASKYGPFNWRDYPVQMMTYLEAMQRHIAALIDGQDLAEDTGIHHLKHIVASGAILLDSIGLGIVVDNRPPKGPAADLLRVLDKTAKSNEPLTLGKAAVEEAVLALGPAGVLGFTFSTDPDMQRGLDGEAASNARDAARLWAEEFRQTQSGCDHGPGPSMEHVCREDMIMAQGTRITAEEWGQGDGDVIGTSGFLADGDDPSDRAVYTHGTPGAFDCNVPRCAVQGHKRHRYIDGEHAWWLCGMGCK